MIVIYIINVVNCIICFTITIIFYNDVKNKMNKIMNNNQIIDYLKNELIRNNISYIEFSNEKYKNICLNNKLKCQSKKIDEQIDKISKYQNMITFFNNNKKKQSLFNNKSEVLRHSSKKLTVRRYFSCNDLKLL